jgi:trans-aconitate 2-methyltransferase
MAAAGREGNAVEAPRPELGRLGAVAERRALRDIAAMSTPPASSDWSPAHYLRFEDERTRAARDLLAAVPLARAAKIVDVGCGPGNSTELLAARFPDAAITGLDSSPAMLAEARRRLAGVTFAEADANDWVPEPDADLVFANAVYHWIPHHLEQLPRVLAALRPGGVVAVQMPDNLAEPSHRLMRTVAEEGPWAGRLAGAVRQPLPPPRAYYEALAPHAARIDIWRTAYNYVLADAATIVDLVSSTGLRPFLEPLSEAERAVFVADYTARIAQAYPPMADGRVLMPFPRFFVVAQR